MMTTPDDTTLAELVNTPPLGGDTPPALVDDIKDASPEVLEAERRKIVQAAGGNFRTLEEDQLMRLAFITGTLRRRASGPPKKAKAKSSSSKGPKPTMGSMGDLL
jgi:hypothetical protein